MRRIPVALAAVLVLAGCDREAEREAMRQAALQRAEAAAAQQAAQYEAARAEGNWSLAKSYSDVLLADYPNTEAAAAVTATVEEVRARAAAEREARRLEALWTYHVEPVSGGEQRTAYLYASEPAQPRVRVILRRHPEWGQSVYLLIDEGEFDCPPGCRVRIAFDDAEPRAFAANKPRENLQALFVEDDAAFIRGLRGAGQVTIEARHAGEPLVLRFEVGGYDPARLGGGR
ncbi:hypothetical protein [Coralloluteibacterium thermophilus]|uniref:Lipoprotein n=1 Tax=Coralloluteibacterium thermophilum TaxID=2707049 RepID=A0ABV9NP31_9GAMM